MTLNQVQQEWRGEHSTPREHPTRRVRQLERLIKVNDERRGQHERDGFARAVLQTGIGEARSANLRRRETQTRGLCSIIIRCMVTISSVFKMVIVPSWIVNRLKGKEGKKRLWKLLGMAKMIRLVLVN